MSHINDPIAPPLNTSLRLSLGLLGLMAVLPFLQPIHHNPIPSFYEEWLAMLLGILAIMAALASRLPGIAIPPIALIPGILGIACLIQLAAGMIYTPLLAMFHVGYMVWAMAMACLGATLAAQVGRERLLRTLATAVLAGALVSALLALVQRMELQLPWQIAFPSRNGAIYANLGQANLLTTYLWLGIASLIHFRERNSVSLWLTIAGVIILGGATGLTSSRMAYLHGAGLIVLSLIQRPGQAGRRATLPRLAWLGLALATIAAAGQISKMLPWRYSTAPASALDRLHAGLVSGDARLDIWREVLTLIGAHPWIGNGVGNQAWRMFEAAATAPAGARTFPGCEQAHNFLLQIGADFGIPLTILIAFLAVRWLLRLAAPRAGSAEEWGCAVLALLAIHSQLEYPLWYAFYLGPCALILGALEPRARPIAALRRPVLLLALAVAVMVQAILFVDYRTLDNTLIVPAAALNSKEDWRHRIAVLEHLILKSSLGPYANGTLALLMVPEHKLAPAQSLVCEPAMRLWVVPQLIAHCALLRRMTGREEDAQALYAMALRAFRLPAQQAEIRERFSQADKEP